MKFLRKIIKNNNYKVIVGILIGGVIFGGGVYASVVSSGNVTYSNSTSGIASDNVQSAIDAIYKMSGDTNISAPSSFSTDSWATIAIAAKSSNYPYQDYPYKVGDTKTFDMFIFKSNGMWICN